MTRRAVLLLQSLLIGLGLAGWLLILWAYGQHGPLAESPSESLAAWLIVLLAYSAIICAAFAGDPDH